MQAWRKRDPYLDSSSLEVTGRLLLCAIYYERAVGTVLQPFGLSIADFDVLNTLRRLSDQHASKPSDMARSSLITTGAMTSRLDRLERAGLIRRAPDADDRRGVLIRLTPQGSKVARQALQEVIAAALKQLLLHNERRRAPQKPERTLPSGLRRLRRR